MLALMVGLQFVGGDAFGALMRGRPDPRFGGYPSNGVVRTHLGANEEAGGVVVLSDGDILLTGVSTASPNEPSRTAVAVRYRPDGTVDMTFGRRGAVRLPVGTDAYGTAFAASPGGRVVVVDPTRDAAVRIRRLLANGRPDPSFGTSGTVIDRPFGDPATGLALYRGRDTVAVQPDGKILVAATGGVYGTWAGPVIFGSVLMRYHADGALDLSFGAGGRIPLPPLVWPGAGALTPTIAVDRQGRIVFGASIWIGINQMAAYVARFDRSGIPDATFGSGGAVIEPIGGTVGITLTSRSEVVLVSWRSDRDLIVRLTRDGTRDRTFGEDGTLTLPPWSAPIAVDQTGRLYVARSTSWCENPCGAVEVRAFGRDGTIDRTFGRDGRTRIAMNGVRDADVVGRWLYVAGNSFDWRRLGDLSLARIRL